MDRFKHSATGLDVWFANRPDDFLVKLKYQVKLITAETESKDNNILTTSRYNKNYFPYFFIRFFYKDLFVSFDGILQYEK